ncbi:LacI family DNA-binding transcriptional regulator [Stackebrandtia soli]|uniref:LacI family DNA-binding transcriptional regulator n=1 Tax=Stackebrandtia soli TaxID=1892856 RepID=UPI0039E83B26
MDHTRPATLADVARRAEVSVATASRVLNGSTHRVSEQLADKVRHVAVDLNYAPNVQAQGLARNTSSVVVVLLHDITDPYFGQIAHGVLAEAARRDVRVVIAETGINPGNENEQLLSLRGFRPRSAIVVGSRTSHVESEKRLAHTLCQLRAVGASVVSVGQKGLPGACLHPCNRAGAHAVAEHFVGLGHRRFAIITGPQTLRVVTERHDGFVAGLPDGAPVDVITAEFSRTGGYEAGRTFAANADRATAVFVTSDVMATGFCTALREAELSIGVDVSVAGFDDIPVAADLYPPLTTVRLPLVDMGVRALGLAIDGPLDEVVQIDTELVVRGSTGPAPS